MFASLRGCDLGLQGGMKHLWSLLSSPCCPRPTPQHCGEHVPACSCLFLPVPVRAEQLFLPTAPLSHTGARRDTARGGRSCQSPRLGNPRGNWDTWNTTGGGGDMTQVPSGTKSPLCTGGAVGYPGVSGEGCSFLLERLGPGLYCVFIVR